MPDQLTTAFKQQFQDSYLLQAQQLLSKTEEKVRTEQISGSVDFIDYIGPTDDLQQQPSLVAPTVMSEMPHRRRQVSCAPYNKTFPLPEAALKRLIADPTGDYMRNLVAAKNRQIDKALFGAAVGTSVSVAYDTFALTALSLPNSQIYPETGHVGMTTFKVNTANTQFSLNEVDDVFPRWLFLSPLAIEDLLMEPEIQMSTAHMLALEAIKNGEAKMLFGFNTVKSNYLPKSGNIRSAIAWVREGMCLGYNQNYYARIENRPDLNGINQLRGHIDFGATRLQETHVYVIQHYEDPARAATAPQ